MSCELDKPKTKELLNARGVDLPCPRCESRKFKLLGKSHSDLGELKVWVIIVACSQCSYLMHHAVFE